MTETELHIDAEKTRREHTVELLTAYRNWIGLLTVLLLLSFVALWWAGALPSVTVPESVQATMLAVIGAAALGYLPASRTLDYLHDPPKRFVVCVGMAPEQADEYDLPPRAFLPGLYELSPAAWDRVRSLDGDLYQWSEMKWPTYEVQAFDEDSFQAVGTWRGSKPDSELLRREKEIVDLRTNLEQAADTSIDTELSISSKVRQATRAIGQALISEHAEASTYEGEQVAEVLSDIRQDIEEDTGENLKNGEQPIAQLRSLSEIADGMEGNDDTGQ
ncbi:hypothetical protein [Halovenus salina]|uniref:DUF8125 domain-containing protein n=1 Tax=Halovenus salina TaxID=1510225 RepID=A0ABD5VXI5_9EURY|nr:hypothetical protein [Halovenus salina]